MSDPALSLREFTRQLPKAELHLHIEGTLEPDLIFKLAQRNQITLPYPDQASLQAAYQFTDLQSFLDLYYAGAGVLIHEQDFFDMSWAYFLRAQADGIVHTEIMFDPQTHTARGVAMETVFAGIARAARQARSELGISSYLILNFLRHLSEADAFETLKAALPLREQYADLWVAIGLDSSEKGNPPAKFEKVYAHGRELGFRLVAHAGEEGPASYVRDALQLLNVERIDHGVRSQDDPALMQYLIDHAIPLTVCPLSNIKLKVFDSLDQHNLKHLLDRGLNVCVNSDDPAYFGGYLLDNYMQTAQALGLQEADLRTLAANSLRASFLPKEKQQFWLNKLESIPGHG
ncbi:adenosine deaminase [Alcaligenes sp. HNGD-HTN06]|uniref:adenosine deaminase n=1 Tax=Alcaligenes sp. HNGD-HTN06 TaxID=3416924 RepID=UPI003CFAC784